MKIIILRVLLVVLIFINFVVTFGFSGQSGTESSGVSRKVTLFLLNIWGNYDEPLNEEQEQEVQNIEHIVRKVAHFSIYALLGFLLMGLASTYNICNKKKIILSLIVGILYASLDEFHQSFIPGRTALVTDVLIDTAGTTTGIIIMWLIIKFYKKSRFFLYSKKDQ
mgnify:CR=1 FL=1